MKAKANDFAIFGEESNLRNARWKEIYGQAGEGPKHQRPGSEVKPGGIARINCAMCMRPMVIVPRTHPFWLRRRDGTVAYMCGPCSGARYRGEALGSYLIER